MILKIHFTLHATNILQKEKMGQNPLKERWEFDVSWIFDWSFSDED